MRAGTFLASCCMCASSAHCVGAPALGALLTQIKDADCVLGLPMAMTSTLSWYSLARDCRMRAAETIARADDMKEAEPKAIMLRIAADYEKIAEWAEKNSIPWWDEKRAS